MPSYIYNSGWRAPTLRALEKTLSHKSTVYHVGNLVTDCESGVSELVASPAARYLREIRKMAYSLHELEIVYLLQGIETDWLNLRTKVPSKRPVYVYYSVPKGEKLTLWSPKNAD
jgi:hypothetical protein